MNTIVNPGRGNVSAKIPGQWRQVIADACAARDIAVADWLREAIREKLDRDHDHPVRR